MPPGPGAAMGSWPLVERGRRASNSAIRADRDAGSSQQRAGCGAGAQTDADDPGDDFIGGSWDAANDDGCGDERKGAVPGAPAAAEGGWALRSLAWGSTCPDARVVPGPSAAKGSCRGSGAGHGMARTGRSAEDGPGSGMALASAGAAAPALVAAPQPKDKPTRPSRPGVASQG